MNYFKIKEIGKIISGSTPKTEVEGFWNGNIPWVTPKEISQLDGPYLKVTERKLTEEGFKSCSATMLPKGSILFTSRAPIGLVAIADIDVCTNQGFKSILLNSGFYPLYIYYLLRNNSRQLQNLGTGTTFLELSKARFEQFEVPVPEFPEQIKIATVLSKAEALIKQRKENIDLLDEFLKSTFLKMFGDPVRNEKGWERVPLKQFGDIITGNTPPRGDLDNYSERHTEWIKTDNIRNDSMVISVADEYLSEKGLKKSRYVEKGALLVACIAGSIDSIGRANLTDRKVSFNQQINAIQPNSEINSHFLYHLFRYARVYIQNHTTKGMKKILTKGEFEKILMIRPPIDPQNEFAIVVQRVEEIKQEFKGSLNDLENLFASLSQRAFKGDLDLSAVKIDESLLTTAIQQVAEKPEGLPTEVKNALEVAANISKQFEKVSDLAKAATRFTKHFETWDKISKSIVNIPQLPNTLLQAQENMIRIQKAFSGIAAVTIPKSQGKITWDKVSSEQFANWIRESFAGCHFTSEMLINFLSEEHVTFPDYYSSEELKKNPKANDSDDFKSFIFAALNNQNSFLKLEQVFYNGETDNINLTLRKEDFELIKSRTKPERTGVYLQIVE